MTKTYKATDPRNWSGDRTVATVRYTTIATILEKVETFESVEVYKTGLSPYRYEFQHAQEDQSIDEYVEENNTPGVPVDRLKLAENMKDLGSYKCKLHITEDDSTPEAYIRIRGAIRNYVVHYDQNELQFELSGEVQ